VVSLLLLLLSLSMLAVRALLRNGANIATATVAPSLGTCPVSQPTGSTVLHMAAAAEDVGMARMLLEAQVWVPGRHPISD
jgi:hypothetical protein